MKISDKRRQELYDAIFQQVMDLRVKLRTGSPNPDEQLDYQLAKLIEKIWNDQKRVLGIIGWIPRRPSCEERSQSSEAGYRVS